MRQNYTLFSEKSDKAIANVRSCRQVHTKESSGLGCFDFMKSVSEEFNITRSNQKVRILTTFIYLYC